MSQRYIGGLIYNPPGGFSGYFDGSGDYLDAGTNAAFAVGTGNFTIELWVLPTAFSGAYTGYFTTRTGGQGFDIQILNSSATLMLGNNSGAVISANNVVVLNTWQHICAVRSGTTNSLYVNGVRVATGTDSTNFTDNGAKVGSSGPSGGNNGTGYISNVRLVKGTAVYDPTQTTITVPSGPLQAITNTSLLTCAYPTFRDGSSNNFTITVNGNTAVSTQNPFPQTQLPNPALGNQGNGVYSMSQYQALRSQNLWPAIDPYFDYVTLMLHGNGTNGAQNNTFLDSSTNNFTITRNGNTTQGTFTPYGSNWSNYFDGSSNLSYTDSSQLNFGTGSYTIEFWINGPSNNDKFILGNNNTSTIQITTGGSASTVGALRYVAGGNVTTSGSVLITDNAWHHCAIVRNGSSNVTLYVDGVSVGTGTDSTNYTSTTSTVTIAKHNSLSSNYLTGYLSNLRILKGTALYTANFTPPVSPLTAISGTSLLTCQSNRFVDNSSSAFTLTVTGSPSVQRFSPFNPTTPYAAGTIGGSGYFDGSGDYLNGPTTGQFAPTGDFTISMWFYPTSFAASYYVLAGSWNAGASDEWLIQYDNTGAIRFLTTTDSTFSAAGVVKLNQWQFLSISRSGSTVTGYINGTSFRSYTLTGTVGSATKTVYVGIQAGTTWPYVGYISDYRLVAGSAQSATPPTSPATAISGTNTLLNFTNGGIIDNAMMNDLETVGNAQISTSVSKFGGGSMYFNSSNADYLNVIAGPVLGTGDFTIEFWQYVSSLPATSAPFSFGTSDTASSCEIYIATNGTIYWYANAERITSSSGVITTGTWQHIAVTRASGTTRLFVNGIQRGSNYADTTNYSNGLAYIGRGYGVGGLLGYIDDFRITRGYARYTTSFTPQRSQWQDQ